MNFKQNLEVEDYFDSSSDIITFSKENNVEPENRQFPIFRVESIENPFFKDFLFDNDEQEKRFLFKENTEEKENTPSSKDSSKSQNKNSKKNIRKNTRKKGRTKKGKKDENENLKKNRCHNKNETDNISTKIQVHYLSFIVSYLNDIIENFGYKKRFKKLDYEFKRKIKKEFVRFLKGKTIGEIISNKISIKYKTKNEDFNERLCDEIKKENKTLNNILKQNYLLLFQKVYCKNKNKISLKEFGEDKEIILSNKVKMLKDLLIKNKDSILHLKKIIKSIKENYYPNLIFEVNYL